MKQLQSQTPLTFCVLIWAVRGQWARGERIPFLKPLLRYQGRPGRPTWLRPDKNLDSVLVLGQFGQVEFEPSYEIQSTVRLFDFFVILAFQSRT